MSPSNADNDPVHKGLHDLGRQIEESEGVSAGPPAAGDEPLTADEGTGAPAGSSGGPLPDPILGPDPGTPDPDDAANSTLAAPHAGAEEDPENNPVERGLHQLGRKIDESEQEGAGGSGGRRGGRGNGRGPAHAAPKKKRSTRRKVGYVFGTLFLVLVLIAGAAAGYGWYLNHEIHRIDLHNLTSSPVKGADAGTENILMIGSTSRCALKVQNPAYGLCSQGVNGVNSDVVMILHLNPANNTLSIMSIPRDLFVPNARSDGANKIDAVLTPFTPWEHKP